MHFRLARFWLYTTDVHSNSGLLKFCIRSAGQSKQSGHIATPPRIPYTRAPPLATTTLVMTDTHSTLTRATTASRKSTIASRNASLIKKNTGPLELRPSDILIERFTGTFLQPFNSGISFFSSFFRTDVLTICRLEEHCQDAHLVFRGHCRH